MNTILSLKKDLLKAKIHVARQELSQQWHETNSTNNANNKLNINNLNRFDIFSTSSLLKMIPAAVFHEDARTFLWKQLQLLPLIKKYQKPILFAAIGIGFTGILLTYYSKKLQKLQKPQR